MNEHSATGACFCGAVRFEIGFPTLFCGHCHCSMCRRSNGAAFVTWVGVDVNKLRILDGSALVRHRSSEFGSRSFCGRCGSPLFCENTKHPERIDVTLASIEGQIDRQPQAHLYYDCRAGWIEGAENLPKRGGATGIEKLVPAESSPR